MAHTKTNLEASWAPVDKLNGALGLDLSNGCIDVLGNYISSAKTKVFLTSLDILKV